MELGKVLATLGILAFVWPVAFFLALLPFYTVEYHLNVLDDLENPALRVLVILICGSAATWVSIWLYRRAFRVR